MSEGGRFCTLFLLSGAVLLLQSEYVYLFTEKNFTEGSGKIGPLLVDGRYLNNLHLVYNVKVPSGKRAKLVFNSFDVSGVMPNCSEDSLEIFVGCGNKSLGKFCGASKPFDIYSKDECITLVFKTDSISCGQTSRGFTATYSSLDKKSSISNGNLCSNLKQNISGNFFSPLWPNHYSPGISCTWELTIPDGYKSRIYFMNLRIEDNVLCNPSSLVDDYIRITAFDGTSNKTVKQRLCTSYRDKTFFLDIGKHPVVYVTFVTDKDNETETGFAAGFMSYKPGITVGDYTCIAMSSSVSNALVMVSLLLTVLYTEPY